MARRRVRTLKARLLEIIVTTMLATGVVSLSAVAWMTYTIERGRQRDVASHIRDAISSKAVTLAAGHALALKGLVADNAFEDTRRLVAAAVQNDSDLVYALFVGPDDKPWVYISPSHPNARSEDEVPTTALDEVQFDLSKHRERNVSQRRVEAFGEELHESSAVVASDDGERLGVIAYGFSNRRLLAAVQAAEARSNSALGRAFLGCGLIGLLSLGIGIAWVSRSAARITQPVAELTLAANEIATGKRGLRVAIQGGEEVEQLASAFNQMLQANEATMLELEATTERALAADRLKGEFLANMSHEIRTPMNGVLGMIHLIQNMALDGKLRRYIDTIDVSANSLLTVINDILDFSKMEAGKYTIRSLPFEPRIVIQEVVELLASRAHEKGIELISRAAADLPDRVLGDPDRFRQILNNLIGNAIKFTAQGEVFVDAKLQSQSPNGVVLEVSVQDTGIGIDGSDLPKLFEAFSQVDGTLMRRHGGTGLGLAISKRLVNMMGGEIHVETRLGEGSRFSFSALFGVLAPESPGPRISSSGRGRRVLVLDANRRWRELIEEQLRSWEMDSQSVESAERALECFRSALDQGLAFDAIVIGSAPTDPAVSDLVRAIRASPEGRQVPLILLKSLPVTSRSPVECEFLAQLSKPIRFSELYSYLTELLPSARWPSGERSRGQGPAALSNKRVLVVDDNQINRFVAVEQLTWSGYQAEEAADGLEALEKLMSGEYLCVLMDCQMPAMDGYEATRRLRALESKLGRRRTPVIALTAHALVGERERVLAAGMDHFLVKPFRPSALEEVLRLSAREGTQLAPSSAAGVALDPVAKRSDKLIRLFLEHVPRQLAELERAVQKGEVEEVRGLAHKLKGSCLAIAARPMGESAAMIQQHAQASELSEVRRLLLELKHQSESVLSLLKQELAAAFSDEPGSASSN